VARANAAPHSQVGRIAAYEQAMLAALAMPTSTRAEIAARNAAIAAARSQQLKDAANKPLSPAVVAQVDSLLGLPPTNPAIGVVGRGDHWGHQRGDHVDHRGDHRSGPWGG
jgi:hypothetical protein